MQVSGPMAPGKEHEKPAASARILIFILSVKSIWSSEAAQATATKRSIKLIHYHVPYLMND